MSTAPLGLFGGTFDPVHFGHLRAAEESRERLGLERLVLLPAGDPPHRERTFAPAPERLEMLRCAVREHPEFEVDDREVRRGGASYMADTLADLREAHPDAPLLLIIGQDSANGLHRWHRWQALFELAHLVVMTRPGARHDYERELARELGARTVDDRAPLLSEPAGRVLYLAITQLAISSTGIREMIAAGRSPRFLLPDPVLTYIEDRGLYRASRD
ncbi:MAG: nicotinate-nucleotide adenylyltransferase [Xanthomonadales bacterium]|nr:nicotinate-nucleotide adenylyltransferase [Xanthomonadales bacterium]